MFDKFIEKTQYDEIVLRFIRTIIKLSFGIIIGIMALGELGVNVTTLIAIFTTAAAAIALAFKDTLAELVDGVKIMLSRPFVKGDLGVTSTGEKVSRKLAERIPNTLLLTSIVILLTWLVGVPLGIIAAVRWRTNFDRLLTVLTSIGMAIPSFFFAVLLLMFAVKTGWFPIGGLTSPNFADMSFGAKFWDITHHLILPVLVLFTISLAGLQRQMRANMLEVLDSDYIKFARAKGLSEWKVIFKHALRNAVNPLITLLGFEFAGLLSGAALTEYVFQYPGLGRLILEAVMKSDINLVMASLMMGTIMLVAGNLIADIRLFCGIE